MEGFTNEMVAIFKRNIRSSAKKDLDCELFYLNKRPQRLTLYLLSSHRYIHIVLENDNTVLIKDLKRL